MSLRRKAKLRTLITLAATAALGLSLPYTAQAAPATPALKVLTYNTFLMSTNLYPNWGQAHRAKEIVAADFFRGNDVVVLQEAFDNDISESLKADAARQYPNQTPVVGRSKDGWDATSGHYSDNTVEDGGVIVMSKWPIVRKEQVLFENGCGVDWTANKGFAYVVLNVNGAKVHFVGTHTQSTDSRCRDGEAVSDRGKQFRQIAAFLDGKKIPANEQVMVAGDLNVDSHKPEYRSMLDNAGLDPADTRNGHPYSFDTQTNSIASYRYPGEEREDLDYVLFRRGHARPAGWTNTVILEKCAPWTVSSWGKDYTYTNLSDHYPVVASAR
ncbi:sphingomyelin phosphodiesterase [Nocardia pseudobrasiliensis]|uniref:Sphingomyelin phosphodiesterase n=1 Tax=Nocardia pseudobrasiliensis TaxID=45979 RepID=A0A370I449_9NOCA|nr:sphingomyelin phosphodiesterase [Nocardia pseudobrasiliensis]RDI64104.1 sphingomyelin phosphodiesterase [Nocardia pseudobrasiliensis]